MFAWIASLSHFAADTCAQPSFFGLPTWYKYLPVATNNVGVCEPTIQLINNGRLDLTAAILIALAILDLLLRVAGLVAVGFIIYAGLLYVTAQGEPDKTKRALSTIINALVGLGITLIAAATVAFLGRRIAGNAASTANGLPQVAAGDAQLQVILSTFFGVLAAAALLVIVIAGFRYVTASGDPGSTAKARNTIIYASIGLIVAMAAFSMVTFVLNNI